MASMTDVIFLFADLFYDHVYGCFAERYQGVASARKTADVG